MPNPLQRAAAHIADVVFVELVRDRMLKAVAAMQKARDQFRDFSDNWDCDEDAHRHGTACRCCTAARAMAALDEAIAAAREPLTIDEEPRRATRRTEGYVECTYCGRRVAAYAGRTTPPGQLRAFRHGQHQPINVAYQLHCEGTGRDFPVASRAGA